MHLELATTEDIISELRRRNQPFVFVQVPEGKARLVQYACQAKSYEDIRSMLQDVDCHVQRQHERNCCGDDVATDVDDLLMLNNTRERA